MAYASQAGRARTSARSPQAHAICDKCGFRVNHVDLNWQHDFAGAGLINTRLLVCTRCTDRPQEQLRAIIPGPDPVPILNPRPQDYEAAEDDDRVTSGQDDVDFWTGIPVPGGDTRVTQRDAIRSVQQTGAPFGSLNNLPGTDPNAPGPAGLPYGNDTVPRME